MQNENAPILKALSNLQTSSIIHEKIIEHGTFEFYKKYSPIGELGFNVEKSLELAIKYKRSDIITYILSTNPNIHLNNLNGDAEANRLLEKSLRLILEEIITGIGSFFQSNLNVLLNNVNLPIFINELNKGGKTALMHAAELGKSEIVKFLLENRASVDIESKYEKHTALHYAIKNVQFSTATILAENLTKGQFRLDYLESALELLNSGQYSFRKVVDALLQFFGPNEDLKNGKTALMYACEGSSVTNVKRMLDNATDVTLEHVQSALNLSTSLVIIGELRKHKLKVSIKGQNLIEIDLKKKADDSVKLYMCSILSKKRSGFILKWRKEYFEAFKKGYENSQIKFKNNAQLLGVDSYEYVQKLALDDDTCDLYTYSYIAATHEEKDWLDLFSKARMVTMYEVLNWVMQALPVTEYFTLYKNQEERLLAFLEEVMVSNSLSSIN